MAFRNDQVSEKETEKILELAREALKVEGDFVEFGCYEGDTSLALASEIVSGRALLSSSNAFRPELYLYDSFEGLPEKTNEDASEVGRDFVKGVLKVSRRDVKARFLRAGLPVPVIKKAWFSDLTDADVPEKIAFAFLDGDLYESIRDSLKLVEKHLVPGAIMVVHDYANPALPGVAKAVDEWLLYKNLKTAFCQSMIVIYL